MHQVEIKVRQPPTTIVRYCNLQKLLEGNLNEYSFPFQSIKKQVHRETVLANQVASGGINSDHLEEADTRSSKRMETRQINLRNNEDGVCCRN